MSIAPFDFDPRTRVVFGPGTLSRLADLVSEYGGKHVLLVTDKGLKAAGHEDRAIAILRESGIAVHVFDDVVPNPTTDTIDQGVEFARQHPIDFIVGLGGGSSLDCAKGVNFLLTNGGRMADYRGVGKATKPMLPLIAIPTTAGTGSEAQSFAVISDAQTHMKMACGDKKAACRAAILDPELTVTMPRSVATVTGIDAISHAIESFVTKKRNPASQLFSLRAWKLLSSAFSRVIAAPDDLDARAAMLLGAHLAGSAIENSMLGATHSLANPLSAHFDTTHGIAIGILLPHVIRFNAQDADVDAMYAQLVHESGGVIAGGTTAGEQLALMVEAFVKEAGQPTTLSECNVTDDALQLMSQEAVEQWTAQFNPRPVDPDSLLELYRCAY